MDSMIAKKMTLCGVVACGMFIAAAASLPVMTGGCGPYETIVCPKDKDAGADDGGQGGNDTGSTGTGLCD